MLAQFLVTTMNYLASINVSDQFKVSIFLSINVSLMCDKLIQAYAI